MKTPKWDTDAMRALCAQWHEDDGIPPRHDRRDADRSRHVRKDHQLCKQVARALNAALQGEARHALLRELYVIAVHPDPDASRLRVEIEPTQRAIAHGATELLAALNAAKGFLRSEVAAAISRKRTPTLDFLLLPPTSHDPRHSDHGGLHAD